MAHNFTADDKNSQYTANYISLSSAHTWLSQLLLLPN